MPRIGCCTCTFRRRRLVLKTAGGRRRELHHPPTTRGPIQNALEERSKWSGGRERENRSKVPSLYAKPRASPLRIEQPGGAASSSAEPAKPPRSAQPPGATFSTRELKFTSRGSLRACGEWTAMLKGAAFAAPAAPGGTPAQRNLLPRE